jgi:hypothetical protein
VEEKLVYVPPKTPIEEIELRFPWLGKVSEVRTKQDDTNTQKEKK